jgi:hypothetical protein
MGIVNWCVDAESANRMLVALRLERRHGQWLPICSGLDIKVERLFGKSIVDKFFANAWPGTELIRHPGLVYIIALDSKAEEMLCNLESSLRNWHHNNTPPMPEDLCIFREGSGYPIFGSCTHEQDAWFLHPTRPGVKGVKMSRSSMDELIIPKGRYFCRTWGSKAA